MYNSNSERWGGQSSMTDEGKNKQKMAFSCVTSKHNEKVLPTISPDIPIFHIKTSIMILWAIYLRGQKESCLCYKSYLQEEEKIS